MSIITGYNCITPSRLDRLIGESKIDPEAPTHYIDPEDEDEESEGQEPAFTTERTWLGLHSLVTFGQWAEQPLLGEAIAGGAPIGGDYCYLGSPIRYLTTEQVRAVSAALGKVDEEKLRASCDPIELNAAKAPPVGGWHEGDFANLWETFSDIRDFFHEAQAGDYAVLVYLC